MKFYLKRKIQNSYITNLHKYFDAKNIYYDLVIYFKYPRDYMNVFFLIFNDSSNIFNLT